jgi:hypothetical protein
MTWEEYGAVRESGYLSFMSTSHESEMKEARKAFRLQGASQTFTFARGRFTNRGFAYVLEHRTLEAGWTWRSCTDLLTNSDRATICRLSNPLQGPARAACQVRRCVACEIKMPSNFLTSVFHFDRQVGVKAAIDKGIIAAGPIATEAKFVDVHDQHMGRVRLGPESAFPLIGLTPEKPSSSRVHRFQTRWRLSVLI